MNKIAERKKEESKNMDEFINFIFKIDRVAGTYIFCYLIKLYFITSLEVFRIRRF